MKTEKRKIRWRYVKINLTFCYICNKDCDDPEGLGYAKCSISDKFNRDIGRKISLARALKSADIDKEERTEIWNAYRDMKPGKRW